MLKLYYVINHIIVKIHNNYNFPNKMSGQKLIKESQTTNI
jgi:hypothetical protein